MSTIFCEKNEYLLSNEFIIYTVENLTKFSYLRPFLYNV
jgi:hypothetical protein